jgi:hypothetical protein
VFDGTRVHFSVFNQNRDRLAFVWSLPDERVNADIVYLNAGARFFAPTGEVALSVLDDRLLFYIDPDRPFGTPSLYNGYIGNAVHVYDLAQGTHFPVYNETNGVVLDVYWVQNGERLLIKVNGGSWSGRRWVLLERDGSVVDTILSGDFNNGGGRPEIYSTPDGFITRSSISYFFDPTKPGGAGELLARNTIYAFNTRDMAHQSYPELLLEDYNGSLQSPYIIWSSLAEPSAPFSSFEPLMPPIPSSEVSTEALSLQVNGAAYVNTINGETLNVRDAPSLSGEVLAQAQNNQRFLLLEGPVVADGFTWWKVLWSERQIIGWAVQGVEDEITLRPPDINRAAPLTLVEANLILGNTGFAPLEVGMYVRVISDNLFIRATTSLNARVDHVLLRGARLTLVDGYTEAEGLRWWEVVTDDGLTGWAADSNPDGELTLAPTE